MSLNVPTAHAPRQSVRKELNLIIIAVKKADGQMVFNPGPYTVIEYNDTLIRILASRDSGGATAFLSPLRLDKTVDKTGKIKISADSWYL